MQYRRLGRSGLRVSCVSLGSWLTMGNVLEQRTSDKLVNTAFDAGINLFDTADVYNLGDGERALGLAIRDLRRQDLVLASKCFFPMSDNPNDQGLSRKHIHESIDQTLLRLGTDYVDLYQCHREDPETPLAETAQAMDDLIRRGKILYWGTSLWSGSKIAAVVTLCRQNGWNAPIANQPRYNLFNREVEAEVLPCCAELGIGQIVYSPLAQGVLSGKYKAGERPGSDTRAANEKTNYFMAPFLTAARLGMVARFVEMARDLGHSPVQLALAWCLRREEVSSVITGASNPEQLMDNLGAIEVEMTAEVAASIEELFVER